MRTVMNVVSVFLLAVVLSTPAKTESDRPLHFLSKQCNEDAVRMRLAPRPFQDVVGSQFSLALTDGKALVLMLAQDCSQHWLDGEQLGSSQDVHLWVSIKGLNDVRPVVGAQETRPTMTWFSVFDGSTSRRAREARLAFGSVQLPIERIVLDPPESQRGGRVSIAKNLSYSWRVLSLRPPARLVGVNHDVYTRDQAGHVVLNHIQALLNVAAADSRGTLEVVGSMDPLPLIGVGSYQVSVNTFFPVWIRGTLGITPSR